MKFGGEERESCPYKMKTIMRSKKTNNNNNNDNCSTYSLVEVKLLKVRGKTAATLFCVADWSCRNPGRNRCQEQINAAESAEGRDRIAASNRSKA